MKQQTEANGVTVEYEERLATQSTLIAELRLEIQGMAARIEALERSIRALEGAVETP